MPKRIFIGGLSARTTEDELVELCRGLDGLRSVRLEHSADGSGAGIVEFTNDESGTAALRKLQGQTLDGRALHVSEAR